MILIDLCQINYIHSVASLLGTPVHPCNDSSLYEDNNVLFFLTLSLRCVELTPWTVLSPYFVVVLYWPVWDYTGLPNNLANESIFVVYNW